MKRVVFLFSVLCFTLFGVHVNAASMDIDISKAEEGYIRVYFNTGTDKKIKLMVAKGKSKYYYNLKNKDEYVNFPLQMGDGSYNINIFENTSGTKYRKIKGKSVDVKIKNENAVFLNPIQEIDFKPDDAVLNHVDLLIKSADANKIKEQGVGISEQEKVDILYNYIVRNIKYDYEKVKHLRYDYLPNNVKTLDTKYGICYDYSSLLAAMLRSQNIPTKLIKGYTTWTKVYHAWNEIYLADEKRWIIVDTTYDSYMYLKKKKFEREKSIKVYSKSKEY